uniref:Uncharacterized protein n=1 Tax=Rhizophora mucronata TaxID=61149 RepID=A0A2P2LDA4_RHIMU
METDYYTEKSLSPLASVISSKVIILGVSRKSLVTSLAECIHLVLKIQRSSSSSSSFHKHKRSKSKPNKTQNRKIERGRSRRRKIFIYK